MHQGILVLTQVLDFLPMTDFRRCVAMHNGGHKLKNFSCFDWFLAMSFAQLIYRESLLDIELNLTAQSVKLYQLGFRCMTISRNTLSKANTTRPQQIYADFAQHLIDIARPINA